MQKCECKDFRRILPPPLTLFNYFIFFLFPQERHLSFLSYSLSGSNIELVYWQYIHWQYAYVAVNIPFTHWGHNYYALKAHFAHWQHAYIAVNFPQAHWQYNDNAANVPNPYWQHPYATVNVSIGTSDFPIAFSPLHPYTTVYSLNEQDKLFYFTEIIPSVHRSIYNQRTNYNLTFCNIYH